jgi:hypothetical protein
MSQSYRCHSNGEMSNHEKRFLISCSKENHADPPIPRSLRTRTERIALKEICPRGNNNIVIIIFLIHDNVYIPC